MLGFCTSVYVHCKLSRPESYGLRLTAYLTKRQELESSFLEYFPLLFVNISTGPWTTYLHTHINTHMYMSAHAEGRGKWWL
jgi:hypothetical protein